MRFAKLLSPLLSLVLLLSACSGITGPSGSSSPAPADPKGRYLEQRTELPRFTNVLALDQTAPDTYYLLGTKNGNDPPFEVWQSEDGGKAWQQKEYAGVSDKQIISAAFAPDGRLYLTYVSDLSDLENLKCKTAFADNSGFTALEGIEALERYNSGLSVTKSGDLLINEGFKLALVGLKDKKVISSFDPVALLYPGLYRAYDDSVAISGSQAITVYDPATGEKTLELPYAAPSGAQEMPRVIAVQADRSGFFYCDHSGLYRITMDGSITEQLIDGTLTSFGLPSVYLSGLFQNSDGSFLLSCRNGGAFELKRFVFDPDAALEPAQNLTLFSLREDPFIRQSIGLYQAGHPDVRITYQPALTEDSAATASDAMRTLSTELLAGHGPDILVLDGLPVNSYMAQGVLADLSETLGETLGDLHPNVIPSAYRQGDSLFAVPARASVSILAGIGIEEIHSVGDFVTYIEKQSNHRVGVTPELLMEQFYPACAVRWFGDTGALDAAAMSEDLAALAQLAALMDSKVISPEINNQALYWGGDGIALINGQWNHLDQMAYVYYAMDKRGGGTVKLFPDSVSGVLSLSGVLGVNAAGAQTALAKDFVRFALSLEAQNSSFDTGLPVNLKALEAIAYSREPGTGLSYGSTSNRETGESYELDTRWFTEAQNKELLALYLSAKNPINPDETIRQTVLAETAKLFAGEQTADVTLTAINRMVERYLQEKN